MRKSPKQEPTDSYFYLATQLYKCMVRYNAFNFHIDPVRTEMNGTQQIPILHVFSSNESGSKGTIADDNLSYVCSTDKSEPERFTINESSTEES